MLDQAVFTSARTARGDGYQVVGRSEGVTDAEAQELAAWGPSHDSLIDAGASAVSYNLLRLASGRMCASRTLPAGAEFSQRGGLRVYTQFLLVDEATFEKFACNAFAILKATLADGFQRVLDQEPASLPKIKLTGRASVVDRAAVDRLRGRLGAGGVAAVMQVLLGDAPVAVAGALSPYLVYTAAVNCLPPECRGHFTFTTGLKYSVRRPIWMFVAPRDGSERRQVVRASGCAVLDTADERLAAVEIDHGWAAFLKTALAGERPLDLSLIFSQQRRGLTHETLEQLGNELAADFANGTLQRGAPLRASGYLRATDSSPDVFNARITLSPESLRAAMHPLRETRREEQGLRDTASRGGRERSPQGPKPPISPPGQSPASASKDTAAPRASPATAHAAHRRFEQTRRAAICEAVPAAAAGVATVIEGLDPKVVQQLEQLDDLVFEAIEGSSAAVERLREAWPRMLASLGAEAIEESRAQYIRRATHIWEEQNGPNARRPELAATALEVLTLLLGSAPEQSAKV